ncbi:MAG TPA: hypothetical protein VGS07_18375 [Thermoanaerobaculia bacterium]|jgi:hypothetical protein|nr:hypothetical protein [Thermoanaerobaculia bacterium]
MGSINTHTIVLRDWEGCLGATQDNAALLAAVEPQRLALADFLMQGNALKLRQDSLIGNKQRITQELKVVIKGGKEAARRLRLAVKATLGTDNEQLVQFNVAPRRPRGKKVAAVKPQPPVDPPASGTPAPETKTTT